MQDQLQSEQITYKKGRQKSVIDLKRKPEEYIIKTKDNTYKGINTLRK